MRPDDPHMASNTAPSFAALGNPTYVGSDALGALTLSPAFSPLYQQIKGLILQSLESGEWKPGEAIPSEMDLAGRFRVSQGTVRKAIDELAGDRFKAPKASPPTEGGLPRAANEGAVLDAMGLLSKRFSVSSLSSSYHIFYKT